MNNVKSRIGNFTSSEIVSLTTNGKTKGSVGAPFNTYIEECNMERRLGLSVSDDFNSKPTSWGTLLEKYVHDLLGPEYTLLGDVTMSHPEIVCWKGSPDVTKALTVGDNKCPFTRKSFCRLVQPLMLGLEGTEAMDMIRDTHKEGDKYYWQLVSNAIITGSKFAELIVYCPYQSELQAIRDLAQSWDGEGQHRFFWIANAHDDELPYLQDNGFYRNLNIIRFEVPEEDKEFLTERVLLAQKSLIEFIPEPVDFE